jgi:hypothetical protein
MRALFYRYLVAEKSGAPIANAADRAQEELENILAALKTVPDFVRLSNFPDHCAGPICWCRPRVVLGSYGLSVHHKNLSNGEFDS